jgi:hypothetical protein
MDREFRVSHAVQGQHPKHCHQEASAAEDKASVMMTLNKKPYTDKEHLLIFPTRHMPQA